MLPVPQDESQTHSIHSRQNVKGVRISCSGDIRILGENKFIAVDVPASDLVWASDKSTLSEMVGVPVRARKFPPHPAWKDRRDDDWYENQAAIGLFRAMDPEQEDFSFVPMNWDLRVGSALVVRDDGKDMTPQQVEALCYYAWEHTTDKFQDASESGSEEEIVKLVALFTPEKFGEFFAEFKAKKMEKDASWVAAVSPV